jgi:ATP-binding cassette subfamily F protein uup
LLLARLFARPANVLVLDEPTNDLDIETLELLEELLQGYEGTVFLVSHDRTFLDNVVTSTIAFEGDGLWREYEGGVQDWLIQSKRSRDSQAASNSFAVNTIKTAAKAALDVKPVTIKSAPSTKKRSNKEQREFDSLPARIEALEQEQAALRAELAGVNLYAKDPQRASAICQRDAAIDEEMLTALARWEALASN